MILDAVVLTEETVQVIVGITPPIIVENVQIQKEHKHRSS